MPSLALWLALAAVLRAAEPTNATGGGAPAADRLQVPRGATLGFRTATAVLDVLYPVFPASAKLATGMFPNSRFASVKRMMWAHIAAGCVVLYPGVALQAGDLYALWFSGTVAWHPAVYLVMAAGGVAHSLTVVRLLAGVMGEQRITIPLYAGMGALNCANAVRLWLRPSHAHAFLLWGSVNTFVYVRFSLFFLGLAHIDWGLSYTYSILAAAFVTFPLSGQPVWGLLLLLGPLAYAPFHTRACAFLDRGHAQLVHVDTEAGPEQRRESTLHKDLSMFDEIRRLGVSVRAALLARRWGQRPPAPAAPCSQPAAGSSPTENLAEPC